MTTATVRKPTTPARVCPSCERFPCLCSRRVQHERCACSGEIAAVATDVDIVAAVQSHQATPVHARWREERGL